MMEGLDRWNLRLVICFILCLFVVFQSTSGQEGFVNIQFCAKSNFTDQNNISWTPDENRFRNVSSCQKIRRPVQNETSHDAVRIFGSEEVSKWCYNLTTTKDRGYLIRGSFPFDALQAIFKVSIGVTPIGVVNSSSLGGTEVEGIFRAAANDYVNFCLLKGEGDPYISKLELRPLNDSEYLKRKPSSVLKLIQRVDVGSSGMEIRYPHDPYDRIWRPESSPDLTAEKITSSTANISINNANITAPPIQVLQTALTHPERLEFQHNDLATEYYQYNLFLYFLELNPSVQAGERVFDIYINNEKKEEIDILAGGSNYSTVALSFTANGFVNLTLIKASNGSQFGPICNAYEILQVYPWVQETAQEDVDLIVEVRKELLGVNKDNVVLGTWSGDPCLPHSWDGLSCELINGSCVITKLDLSSRHFQGSFPPSITQLTHLKELNMSNNDFTQTIPEFPPYSILTSVDLSHNDFMGIIPDSLVSLPYLKILYFGCNPHFSQELPTNFNSTRFNATDKGICGYQGSSRSTQGIIIGTVAGGSLLVTIAVGIFVVCFYRQKLMARGKFNGIGLGLPMTKNMVFSIPSMDDIVLKSISIQNFTLESIETATHMYKTLIGEGGFGSVYRGTLPDGQEVAVKVRSATSTQGTREFDNELNLLSAIRHENLVPLLGYCCENDQQMLVYPFMSNGSLQDRLYGEAAKRKTLDWATRLSVALGAARGLTYLHTFAGRCVIHRDVKSSNILLDHSMCAKVADFGFSKYAPQEGDSGASLEVRGTAGYLDPEYYSTQHLSAKSDVFSFGVVLLEIVSGREPLNIQRPRNEWSLVEWAEHVYLDSPPQTMAALAADLSATAKELSIKAKPYIRNSRIDEIVDPGIKGGYHAEAMWRVVEVALACIEPFSAYRPCMADIVRELEDALIIENNASEYMKSIDSFGGSNRFSIERPIVLPPTPSPTEASSILSQPTPPQPR